MPAHIGSGHNYISLMNATNYTSTLSQIIKEEDSNNCPLWMSEVTGVSKSQMMPLQKHLGMIGSQMYLERINPNGSGYKQNAIANSLVRTIVDAAKTIDASSPMRYPRAETASFGLIYDPILTQQCRFYTKTH